MNNKVNGMMSISVMHPVSDFTESQDSNIAEDIVLRQYNTMEVGRNYNLASVLYDIEKVSLKFW